jgi:hypothetical protein
VKGGALRSAFRLAPVLAILVVLSACARRGPPTGGPPDLEPPIMLASNPDSGAQGVRRDVHPTLIFNENMDDRASADAVSIVPTVGILERRWSGRRLTVTLAESLKANQTYTMFLGRGVRDRHGNSVAGRATMVFTTADTMPPGVIDGTLQAKGFPGPGTYRVVLPGGTQAGQHGARLRCGRVWRIATAVFRVVGLHVPGRYRLWAFADLNVNRSFEPSTDVLSPIDTTFDLTRAHPVASGFLTTVVNPAAAGRVSGAVLDSLGDSQGTILVFAVAAEDSARRVSSQADRDGKFELLLAPGAWRLRAWRDLDRDRIWRRDREPASPERRIDVPPAGEVPDVQLVLERPSGER